MKYYTGIGSRSAPIHILVRLERFAEKLAKLGWTLRSGGADGADSACESGCDKYNGHKEIFLPWPNFNGHSSSLNTPMKEAFEYVDHFHPRNAHQILGQDLKTPSKFVLCWTKSNGGTEQALRIARYYNISIFNLLYSNNENLKENGWNLK